MHNRRLKKRAASRELERIYVALAYLKLKLGYLDLYQENGVCFCVLEQGM